jgi:predicted acylesterase/phospholipase RssA
LRRELPTDHGNLLFDLESVRELKLPQQHTGTYPNAKVVNLALQGGGSHGAFTWGVLDRLLEEKRLSFEGISATSAGAVNAVVLADGLPAGGRVGARDALRTYWQKSLSLVGPWNFQAFFVRQKEFRFRPRTFAWLLVSQDDLPHVSLSDESVQLQSTQRAARADH